MIAVDIGNTSIKVGNFRERKLLKVYTLKKEGINKKRVSRLFWQFKKDKPIILCSVVPEVNSLFLNLKRKTYWVGSGLKVPVSSQYDKNQIGADRLVAAYSAKKEEPLTRIIIDFGTAITIDILSKQGDYQGGIILPGISSTLKTFKNCSLLPNRIKIKKRTKLIPTNTSESINKGLQEGFSQMLNGLISKYKKELNLSQNQRILVTGGDFLILKPYLKFKYKHKKHLVLKGLNYLYQEFVNS